MSTGIKIQLQSESIVNERSGEIATPSEYVQNLRHLERRVQERDDEIVRLKGELQAAKKERETAVAELRSAIRDGAVKPLLEVAETSDAADEAGSEDEAADLFTSDAPASEATPEPEPQPERGDDPFEGLPE